jgi:filamentous hemagglutinin
VSLTAENVNNLGGRVGGNDVSVAARQDLNNIGGSISAVNSLNASAGRDLNVQTTTRSASSNVGANSFSRTTVDRVAGLYVSGADGTLVASAGRDLNIVAGVVSNAGSGNTSLSAGNNLKLSNVTTASTDLDVWDAQNYRKSSSSTDVGSTISGGGNVNLKAGNDLTATAANVQATGSLSVQAQDVRIEAGRATTDFDEAHKVSGGGFFGGATLVTRETSNTSTAVASNFGGGTVDITANAKDIAIKGSNVVSDNSTTLTAGGSVNIEAATNSSQQSRYRQKTETGFLSGGGLSVSYGTRTQSNDGKDTTTTAAASTVGSVGGNVTITAGNQYKQVGSDVLTPKGDINITAKTVDIQEARETNKQSTEQKFEQSGLTVAISSGLINNLQGAQKQQQAASQTKDDRMKALAVANEVASVAAAAQNATQVDLTVSLGSSKSESKQTSQSNTTRGSEVAAAGTVNIKATGGGQASNLTVQGSDVSGKTVNLEADNKVNLLAAQNTSAQTSTSSNSSASVGGSIGTSGIGITASASLGKGSGNGTDTSYTNTHINGADGVSIKSGGDTTLKGATVEGKQVTATVGGNLQVESLQDSSTYAEKNQQVGGSVMVGVTQTGLASGNVNYAKSNINSTYASVTEQSGIKAGDGGFTVNVQGNTDLKGGAITSTQAAVDNNKNSFSTGGTLTTSDIQNKAAYDANSVSVNIGMGSVPGQSASAGMSGVGFGTDKGSANSTTTAGISGIAGDTAKRTGDAQQGIKQIFNKDQVKAEVNAQTAITSEFGKNAAKAVGEYAATQLKKAQDANDPAGIAAWSEGGSARVALHTAVGALTGGTAGAVGAGTSQAAIDQIGQAIKNTDLPVELKQTLVAVAGTAVGVAASGGSVAGGATAFNATTNNYLSATDLRNRDQRLAEARKSGNVQAELNILKEYDVKSAKNTGAINYNSVLTEGSLKAEKTQLEALLNDTTVSVETKAQAQRSINELNTAINVIQKSPILKDAAEAGLILADVLTLGEMAAGKALTSGVVKEFIAARTGKTVTDDAAMAIANNFYRDGDDLYAIYKNSNGGWNWPPNAGAVAGTEKNVTLKPGDTFDRYGSTTGNYVAPAGTSIGDRALAPGGAGNPLNKYEVIKPLPDAIQSQVAPAFGQTGGGVQIELKKSIQWYIDNGYLKAVK